MDSGARARAVLTIFVEQGEIEKIRRDPCEIEIKEPNPLPPVIPPEIEREDISPGDFFPETPEVNEVWVNKERPFF